jgi:hypothetical protein
MSLVMNPEVPLKENAKKPRTKKAQPQDSRDKRLAQRLKAKARHDKQLRDQAHEALRKHEKAREEVRRKADEWLEAKAKRIAQNPVGVVAYTLDLPELAMKQQVTYSPERIGCHLGSAQAFSMDLSDEEEQQRIAALIEERKKGAPALLAQIKADYDQYQAGYAKVHATLCADIKAATERAAQGLRSLKSTAAQN